jgi:D-arabinose 1-dehydrogenase-like Zn-dependent alcohol dehydrogenase
MASLEATTMKTMKAALYREFGGPISIENVPIPRALLGGVVLEVNI